MGRIKVGLDGDLSVIEEIKTEDEILVAAASAAKRLLPDLYAKRAELFSKIQAVNWQIKQYDNVITAAGLTEATFTRDIGLDKA